MSITINGTTNTLTAASGLTIAGNTAITGTLSATGKASAASMRVTGAFVDDVAGSMVLDDAGNTGGRVIVQGADALTQGAFYVTTTLGDGTSPVTVGTFTSTGLAVTGTLSASGITSVTDTTDATSTTSASLKTAGGLGVAKKAYIGTTVDVGSGSGLGALAGDFHKATGLCDVGIYANDSASGTANAQLRLYTNGASGGDPIVNWEVNAVTRYYMGIDNSNSDKLVIGQGYAPGSADYLTIDSAALTLGSGLNIVMASGKGIDFSATSNGSGTTTSEVLSDYEEGTWTPAYSTTGGSFTYAFTGGTYTKIGRKVTVQGSVQTATATVGTGQVYITGLPFTCSSTGGVEARNGCSIGSVQTFAGDYPSEGVVFENTTTIQLFYRATSNGASAALDGTDLTAGAGNQIMFSATYFV